MGFEKGWNMLSGVYGQPINKWSEALKVKKQLLSDVNKVEKGEKPETTFKTVVVDTADLAYMMCEDYILAKEGVEYLDETESKRGYKAVKKEFNMFFQEIVKAGYTLIFFTILFNLLCFRMCDNYKSISSHSLIRGDSKFLQDL